MNESNAVSARSDIPGARDFRNLLPLWRIRGTFILTTPMHIGTGRDAAIVLKEYERDDKKNEERFVATVVRDRQDKPYIPGSSLKGALNALARRANVPEGVRRKIFGAEASGETQPAQVEFCNLYRHGLDPTPSSGLPNFNLDEHSQVANLPHVARNRERGTAEDQKLFLEQVVPPGCTFDFECTASNVDDGVIQHLLGVLTLASADDSPLRLGAGKSADQGIVTWQLSEVRKFESPEALWRELTTEGRAQVTNLWCDTLAPDVTQKLVAELHHTDANDWLILDKLSLTFHTPFLVYQRQRKVQGERTPDGAPRTGHDPKRAVLPASSLHGALRSQGERILRTLGEKTPEGYRVPAVNGIRNAASLDLASVLFGAPGWRSVVQCGDFAAAKCARTITHEMLAIDRLTGGGREGAKFNILALDCPTITGTLRLDLRRLKLLEQKNRGLVDRAIGLLAHVLRDLDEGDIPLGYGAAKGYGISTSQTVGALRAAMLHARLGTIDAALVTFAQAFQTNTGRPAATPQPGLAKEPQAPMLSAATGDFHNPYVFIPFGTSQPKEKRPSWESHEQLGEGHHSHAMYASNALHGRLVCRLTTRTPIFIGAGDIGNDLPKRKDYFKLKGEVALPATSLRGMISSLHEAITCSALRVMHDRKYSVRQQTGGMTVNAYASSAIGRIHIQSDGSLSVEPLTLPTLASVNRYAIGPEYAFCYQADEDDIRRAYHKVLLEPRKMVVPETSDYAQARRDHYDSDLSRGYWYLPLQPLIIDRDGTVRTSEECRYKGARVQGEFDEHAFVIGQRPTSQSAHPLSENEFQKLESSGSIDGRNHVRGLLRAMDYPGRELPPAAVRKYELFVPLPAELDELELYTLPCTPPCVDRFNALADEKFELQEKDLPPDSHLLMPYVPNGRSRARASLRPQAGDLVFFKPSREGASISEISYSSIWRARLETIHQDGETHAITTATALPDTRIAPQGCPGRGLDMSPSELLFGVVALPGRKSPDTETDDSKTAIKAFASKVRFGHGRALAPPDLAKEITLKILASPKPPSPAMYFARNERPDETYVRKTDLVKNPADFKLKGRKAYLHALRRNDSVASVQLLDRQGNAADNGNMPWESADPNDARTRKQKVRICPIEKGQTFFFEVDFANLSQAELESLCASLMPHRTFEHKIGMGKPIGLGSVKIEVVGMFLINRATRYSQKSFTDDRYSVVYKDAGFPAALPEQLRREQNVRGTPNSPTPASLAHAQMADLKANAPEVFNAILLSGNPDAVKLPVHYPQLADKLIEHETFEWFVNNDRQGWQGRQQGLAVFTRDTTSLPALSNAPRVQPARAGGANPRPARGPGPHRR